MNECESTSSKFGAADYAVFVVMLVLSASIGVFWALVDRKKKSGVQGYLMAGRQMHFLPASISLALTLISSVTILGVPSEIYFYGTAYIWFLCGIFWVFPLVIFIFIPFFYRLNVTSTFEYLGSRFNNTVRLATTGAYIIQTVFFIGIMIYAPALALSAVTGFNLWAAIFTIGIVCTFYTTLGGLKAVIWTDVLQGIIVCIATLTVLIMSVNKVGGFNRMWEINQNGSRIDFVRFETDPRYRTTFWSMTFGLGCSWMSMFGVNQAQVQRYLCCKSESEGKKSFMVSFVLSNLLLVCCAAQGLVAYAYFNDCDPISWFKLSGGQCGVEAPDQVVPYMVMNMFGDSPGLPGLYVAGVFAGCLSTVSSGMNAMACVTLRDFISPFVNWQQETHSIVSKVLVFAYGFLCIALACLATLMGNILQAALSVSGVVGGPTLGVFALGMMMPYPNSIGAGTGLIAGLFLSGWIYIGSTTIEIDPTFTKIKDLSFASCPNITLPPGRPPLTETEENPLQDFYSVSYAYYAAVGCATTLVVGLLVSVITRWRGVDNEEVPQSLVWVNFDRHTWRFIPESVRKVFWCDWDRSEEQEEKAPSNGKVEVNKISPSTIDYKIAMEDSFNPGTHQGHEKTDGLPEYIPKSAKGADNEAFVEEEAL